MIVEDLQQQHSPSGHQDRGPRGNEEEHLIEPSSTTYRPPSGRLRKPPTMRDGTPSPDSLPLVPKVKMWPAPVAYDAYHEADFTLVPLRSVLQRSRSGNYEQLVSGPGQGKGQGWATKPPTTAMAVQGMVFPLGCLDYQDFAPEVAGFDDGGRLKCQETFTDLVTRANDWLRQNPQLTVRSCETITWSTSRAVEVGDTENMVKECHVTQNGDECYCFSGLRLWVIPSQDASNSSSSLFSSPSSTSSSSSSSSSSSPSFSSHPSPSAFSSASIASDGQRLGYRDYKPQAPRGSLSRLVHHVNEDLKERPLPGRIATCETVFMPDFLAGDTRCVYWTESYRQQHQRVVFLRLFYIIGSITQLQTIGVKNIVPECVNGTYEPFSGLLQRATLWAKKERRPIQITNLKSYTMPCNACTFEEEANRCSHSWLEQTSSSRSSSEAVPHQRIQQHCFLVLRVFYVSLHPVTLECISDDATIEVHQYFPLDSDSCRTRDAVLSDAERIRISCAVFSPVLTSATNDLQQVTFERMRQTLLRIRSWIQTSATSGVNIHSIESYASPLLFCAPNHTLPELTYWTHPNVTSSRRSERKFLNHIRVYFEHSSSETPQESKLFAPNALCPVSAAVESMLEEEERKRRQKEGRWRKRKLRLLLSCIMTFAICVPAGGLFYLNALQTEWGKA